MTPDAIDFINQPATVDLAPLLAPMPRKMTPLDEGLGTYLSPGSGPGTLEFGRGARRTTRGDRRSGIGTEAAR